MTQKLRKNDGGKVVLDEAEVKSVLAAQPDFLVPGSVVVTPGVNGITVEWVSDEDSSGQLAYGSSTNLGQVTALEAGFATNHSVAVSNWTVNVPLNFRIVNSDPLNQVGTNTLMRSFSIPALAITEVAPGSVRPKWISDAGQWELLESPGLAGPFNAVTNVPVNANITNSVTLPATNTVNYYQLQRTTAPGYVDIGP